jgi:hypothetical protein
MNADALSSGTILSLTSNGTAGLTGQKGLNISLAGTNGTSAQTTYGHIFLILMPEQPLPT